MQTGRLENAQYLTRSSTPFLNSEFTCPLNLCKNREDSMVMGALQTTLYHTCQTRENKVATANQE